MPEEDQRWVEEHALAFALGQLDANKEQRFRNAAEHSQWASLLEERDLGAVGHVPAALLARWTQSGRDLGALERQLVADHLESCLTCQEELEIIELAGEFTPMAGPPRARWRPWFGGAVLGAIAATLVLVVVREPQLGPWHGRAIDVISPTQRRSAQVPTLRLADDARAFVLVTGLPTEVVEGSSATLLVRNPEGELVLETPLGAAPWSPPTAQVVLGADAARVTGEYTVLLRVSGEGETRDLGRFAIAGRR